MTVEGGLPSLLERGRNGEVAPIPAVREVAIELLGSTQSGPPTGTASRLTMTQTHSGPPGLMVDFGHRFRKARPLDGIDASVVSESLRVSQRGRSPMPGILGEFTLFQP